MKLVKTTFGDIAASRYSQAEKRMSLRAITDRAEKNIILDALTQTGWNVTRAAKSLGISRATLQSKIKTHNLRRS